MLEAAIKIVAMGFVFAEYTYLRNGWNVLDFVVVLFCILELTSFGNYTFVRCFRAFRLLRAITKIESLRIIVESFISALPMLRDVGILVLLYFSVFGIACLELFKGKFYNRCGTPDFKYSYADGSYYAVGSSGTLQTLSTASNCVEDLPSRMRHGPT
ncbi:hypothetical protein CEUSTIGMA_g4446.t1 [Chlamydomonas eustigma]|uniref:Ion transport domain-containing protein n=1 Tax=Chlamydomonas eustigma TaxID=1157962 RepID=A0A250X239_9CHLO|nr:hypothetical protein CEUSTIGMA_g4446.t1 [Chlamydomonas eustigma]|eukprot:GAX76999.1 hypothetical protein CEUSTIGMA_g4446.t1 [Chlamydomonas eustigma]